MTGTRINSLIPSAEVIRRQEAANKAAETRTSRGSWRAMTIRTALQDARDAVFGLTGDLYGNTYDGKKTSLRSLVKEDRVRGVGVVVVVLSVVWMLIDAMLD